MKEKLQLLFNNLIEKNIKNQGKEGKENYSFLEDLDEKIENDKEKEILPLKEQFKDFLPIPKNDFGKLLLYKISNFTKKLYVFEYKDYKNPEAPIIKGIIRGSNKIDALENAKNLYNFEYAPGKILPVTFQKERLIDKLIADPSNFFRSRKVNKMQLGEFLKEYASLMEDEFTKEDTIENLKDIIKDKTLKEFSQELATTSYKMSQLMKITGGFDEYTMTIIESAESSGGKSKFYDGIKHLGISYINEEKFKKDFISSLIYPGVLFSAVLVLVYAFLKFVMPSLYGLFSELVGKNGLPSYMTSMLNIGNDLELIIFKFLLILLAIYVFLKILSSNIFILVKWNLFKLNLPLYGIITKIIEENRIIRILSQTIDSNLSHLDKIQSFEKSTSNELYKRVYRYMYKIYPTKQNLLNTFLDSNEKFGGQIFSNRFIGTMKIAKGIREKVLEKYNSFLLKNTELLMIKMKTVQTITTTLIILTIAGMVGGLFTLIVTLVLNVTSKM